MRLKSLLKRLKKKEDRSEWLQTLIFNANRKGFVDALPQKDRETLINLETDMRPKSCVECIFYYNVFDECGFCGGGCTMSDGLEIYDNLQKHKDCPLTKNDVKRVDIPPVR